MSQLTPEEYKKANWWFVFFLAGVTAIVPLAIRLVFEFLNPEYAHRIPLALNLLVSLITFSSTFWVAGGNQVPGPGCVKAFVSVISLLLVIGSFFGHIFLVLLGPAFMMVLESGVMGSF